MGASSASNEASGECGAGRYHPVERMVLLVGDFVDYLYARIYEVYNML